MLAMATRADVDLVIVATGGVVSLRPVLAALEAGKVVATANKETLVAGGHLVMPLARARAAEVRGQARRGRRHGLAAGLAAADRLGALGHLAVPCRRADRGRRTAHPDGLGRPVPDADGRGSSSSVTPADALAHPTWRMGAKITIDSATLMNKGLEVIEAHWLYDCDYERIDVVVHPQSVIHSAVEFVDGSSRPSWDSPTCASPSSTP